MLPSVTSRQPNRKRKARGESNEEEPSKPARNNGPQDAGDSEYMICTCGSTIKKKGFGRHFYTDKHMDYLIPVLEREAKEDDEQREEELRLQRAAAEAAVRAQAVAATRATTSALGTAGRDLLDAKEACSEDDEDEASCEDEV